jgi:hypothetical protein
MGLWTIQKIMLLVCLVVIYGQKVHANEFQQANVTISRTEKKPAKVNKPERYELRGSLNREPVYLIVEKAGPQQVVGYLFDGEGNKKYIYGEWFKNSLQVYDQSNQRFTIVLPH